MYRFKSTRYLVMTAILIALLVVISMLTVFLKISNQLFQITDGFYLSLVPLIPGPMMLVVGIIYSPIMDLLGGAFIYIPITIIIHSLMFIFVKIFTKWITAYGSFVLSSLLILIYVLYTYLINLNLNPISIAINELIVDGIQIGITIIISSFLYFILNKPALKSALFNDRYYQSFKKNKK